MFIVGDSVKRDLEISNVATQGFKLSIHEQCLDDKTAAHVHALNLLYRSENCLVLLIENHFGSTKLDVS